MTEITDAEARAMALQGIVEIARGVDIAISEIRSGKFMDAQGSLLLAKAGAIVAEAAVQKIRTSAALIAEAVDQARAEERERIAPDPRIVVQSYVVTPTGYDAMVHSDKDMWCLTVTDGHAWGWSIRRGVGMSTPMAMNRKGEWIVESRGSGRNKPRRWPLDEALSIALAHVDSLRINGHTAQEASDSVAARIARSQP